MTTNDSEAQQIRLARENVDKYRPADTLEHEIVYQIIAFQWANRCLESFYLSSTEKRQFAANTSLIAALERRLAFIQSNWPKKIPERTQDFSPQSVENKQNGAKKRKIVFSPAGEPGLR
ncbi:MAG: hypothetical protein ACKV2U_17610 [Bryobacteraceae bacterium]